MGTNAHLDTRAPDTQAKTLATESKTMDQSHANQG
jgi:hypothetical protein